MPRLQRSSSTSSSSVQTSSRLIDYTIAGSLPVCSFTELLEENTHERDLLQQQQHHHHNQRSTLLNSRVNVALVSSRAGDPR